MTAKQVLCPWSVFAVMAERQWKQNAELAENNWWTSEKNSVRNEDKEKEREGNNNDHHDLHTFTDLSGLQIYDQLVHWSVSTISK